MLVRSCMHMATILPFITIIIVLIKPLCNIDFGLGRTGTRWPSAGTMDWCKVKHREWVPSTRWDGALGVVVGLDGWLVGQVVHRTRPMWPGCFKFKLCSTQCHCSSCWHHTLWMWGFTIMSLLWAHSKQSKREYGFINRTRVCSGENGDSVGPPSILAYVRGSVD